MIMIHIRWCLVSIGGPRYVYHTMKCLEVVI